MKRLSFSIILIFLIIAASDMPQAKVTGVCSNCHTMHNSQGGGSMNFDGTTLTPIVSLLRGSCKGCHQETASTDWNQVISGAPVVFNASVPSYGTNGLAAGNFHYCDTDGEKAMGHNVKQISSDDDSTFASKGPPGFTAATKPTGFTQSGADWGPSSWTTATEGTKLTCAGEYGCHGDRSIGYDDYEGIQGAHHGDDLSINGTTVAKSYRFLAGIKGVELNASGYEWERNADSSHHNGYYGVTAYNDSNTISYLCGECHGNYHAHTDLGGSQVGTASPWLRHPTDKLLSGGEYANYTTYDVLAPPALAIPATNTQNITDIAIVMCLSCHRAHASPYYKMMRWNYRDWPGTIEPTGSKGCATCHTSKG